MDKRPKGTAAGDAEKPKPPSYEAATVKQGLGGDDSALSVTIRNAVSQTRMSIAQRGNKTATALHEFEQGPDGPIMKAMWHASTDGRIEMQDAKGQSTTSYDCALATKLQAAVAKALGEGWSKENHQLDPKDVKSLVDVIAKTTIPTGKTDKCPRGK